MGVAERNPVLHPGGEEMYGAVLPGSGALKHLGIRRVSGTTEL